MVMDGRPTTERMDRRVEHAAIEEAGRPIVAAGVYAALRPDVAVAFRHA
jgi:hypothetical protein